jgi:hypothetical protein
LGPRRTSWYWRGRTKTVFLGVVTASRRRRGRPWDLTLVGCSLTRLSPRSVGRETLLQLSPCRRSLLPESPDRSPDRNCFRRSRQPYLHARSVAGGKRKKGHRGAGPGAFALPATRILRWTSCGLFFPPQTIGSTSRGRGCSPLHRLIGGEEGSSWVRPTLAPPGDFVKVSNH